jgi:hypothetical protein
VDLVLPSHGAPFRGHRPLIASYRLLQCERQLRKGPLTPFALARRIFPRHWETQLFLVMSEVIGHLDVLEDSGRVAIELREGVEQVHLVGRTEAEPCG